MSNISRRKGNQTTKFGQIIGYPDNCPPRKITPWLGLGFGSRLVSVLGLGGDQLIAPDENCLPVRVGVWIRVSFGVGAIVLEPIIEYNMRNFSIKKSYTKCGGETIPRPFFKKPKLRISLDP